MTPTQTAAPQARMDEMPTLEEEIQFLRYHLRAWREMFWFAFIMGIICGIIVSIAWSPIR